MDISILPRYSGSPLVNPGVNNTKYEELNTLLKVLVTTETTANSKVSYLDLVPEFSNPPGLFYDGTHPNLAGEMIIGNAVYNALVPDSDDDGLIDLWELNYLPDIETSLPEDDADGLSNKDEFDLGSSPVLNDATGYITFAADSASPSFTLPLAAGAGYAGLDQHYTLSSALIIRSI